MGTAQLLLVVVILVPIGDVIPLFGALQVPAFPAVFLL